MNSVMPSPAPQARQVRPGMTSASYRASFPAEQLRADLCARFRSVRAAAKHAGLNYWVVCGWLWRRRSAKGDRLRRLLEACGLPLAPYQPFLEPLQVTLVCPTCGHRRTRRSLREIVSRVKGGRALVRRPDGNYELPCRRHIPARHAKLRAQWERRLYNVLGREKVKLANWILEELKKPTPDPKAVRMWTLVQQACFLGRNAPKELAAELRKPRPDLDAAESRLRAAQVARGREIGGRRGPRPQSSAGAQPSPTIASVLARFLRQPFHLCPLCELAIYKRQWHRVCFLAWIRWSGHRPSPENWPPRTRTRGPSPERDLRRNLRWLLAQQTRQRSQRALAAAAGREDSTTVRKGALAALRLLPGSWDVLAAREQGAGGNRTRQRYLPLPGDSEFRAMIDAGERDALIRRLYGYAMPEAAIARITGASLERIDGVLVRVTPTENASA